MKKKSIIAITVMLLVILGLVGYRITKNKEKDAQNAASGGRGGSGKGAKVYGIVVRGEEFADFISLSGSIEANEQIDIHSEVSGIVESINFSEGNHVGQGQVLFTVNDSELRAQLAQATTRSTLAGENERRAKLLLEKEAISQEEYDIASADFRTAKAQIQLIQAQLNKTVVRAPFSGTIGLRNISKGSYVTPATVVAQLVNLAQVKILFSIPEKYAGMVNKGTRVSFTVKGSEEAYTARVIATEPTIETTTRTLLVKGVADNPSRKLIPGTFASVTFPLETLSDGLLVPAEALIPVQNGKKIFVMRGGKAKEIMVETGGRTDSHVLISAGIIAGDTVLTSGVMSLRDGASVQVNLR
ncbi:efflux RND transporter periplasmic adaptor subunit [Sphingobacterium psychroaquaticum]|uniref:Membrane fusion protein, multidrug efflux system n=1 Tax=Sphingobacterium psychroaquaticum TaxID=561061 RepID=A0A1X7L8S1_9SPHI|nr:efflux RND transporter periplasmic adaptor subunit [Sphingobacterium psychroaquaticum]SMG50228.1 membrane fusion protein, multidrug efflux system [Sphingobacterium psychroaquaticum]